jgi:hypothetical protein
MSFDKGHLRSVFQDVETYLGYLKGNELAYDYLLETGLYFGIHQVTPGPDVYTLNLNHYPGVYEFPCPDGAYRVRPEDRVTSFTIGVDPDHLPAGDPFAPLAHEVREHADQAWRNGASWAAGLGDYLYSLCAQFVEPDAATLAATVRQMQHDVVSALDLGARDDWAQIGALLGRWHGEAQYAFSTFYDNYNDALAQCAVFSAYVCAGFAAATRIIAQTQLGVVEFAESIRDALDDQLVAWRLGKPPADTPKTPAWIAKVEEIASDSYALLDHVPVVSVVKGEVDKVMSIVGSVNAIAGDLGLDTEPPHEERPFKARTAEELYTDVTNTLNDDYYRAFVRAMNQLYSGTGPTDVDHANRVPFSAQNVEHLLQSLKDRYDWGLPDVSTDSLRGPHDHY